MIKIYKSKRLLELVKGGEVIFTCGIALGFCPEGRKTREGDGKTPEGRYRVCTVNRNSKFHISLGISYPGRADALNAYKGGTLGLKDTLLICAADLLRVRPKWNSPLGGYVMLHGEHPEGKTGDWTQGCVAVSDAAIETIANLCKKGEAIEISP